VFTRVLIPCLGNPVAQIRSLIAGAGGCIPRTRGSLSLRSTLLAELAHDVAVVRCGLSSRPVSRIEAGVLLGIPLVARGVLLPVGGLLVEIARELILTACQLVAVAGSLVVVARGLVAVARGLVVVARGLVAVARRGVVWTRPSAGRKSALILRGIVASRQEGSSGRRRHDGFGTPSNEISVYPQRERAFLGMSDPPLTAGAAQQGAATVALRRMFGCCRDRQVRH
jgi:hypothetical protein